MTYFDRDFFDWLDVNELEEFMETNEGTVCLVKFSSNYATGLFAVTLSDRTGEITAENLPEFLGIKNQELLVGALGVCGKDGSKSVLLKFSTPVEIRIVVRVPHRSFLFTLDRRCQNRFFTAESQSSCS